MINTSSPRQFNVNSVCIITLLMFGPYLFIVIFQSFVHSALPWLTALGIWQFMISWLLLGNIVSYSIVCIGLLGLSFWNLSLPTTLWWQKWLSSIGIALILWFMIWPYQPAVAPANGYSLSVVTKPRFWLNGFASAQAIGEHRPCSYTILGWDDITLYYRATCLRGQPSIWYFTPEKMSRPARYQAATPSVTQNLLSQNVTWQVVQAFASDPPNTDLRGLYVRSPGVVSPNGKWIALIAEHLYSRADIVLISQE